MSITRHHNEWLSLVPNSGPFLSLPVLAQAFPQGLDAHDPDHARRLRMAFDEWDDNQLGNRPDPRLHRAWMKFVLAETLGYDELLAEGQAIPQTLKSDVAEYGETLRPDWIVNDPATKKVRLLVQVFPRSQSLTKPVAASRWKTSPDTRMMQLLHDTGIRLGIVTNGDHWMLVNAPKNETTGYVSWYANLWLEEKDTLRAFRTLLGADRLFSVPEGETLESLLNKSANDQQEVTDQLGYQVRKAVEVLIQSLDKADQEHGRKLLAGVNEKVLYESALTVMMRLEFLFCAEERELLLLGDDLYDKNYAVSTLREQLRVTADQFGEEILGLRYDAWSRLLTTFRAVYAGAKHDRLKLPAYGGSLFNPDRFPFLEGRKLGTHWKNTEATPLPISNRTVLHLLEALQVLQTKIGNTTEARKISFRALDIEQIGHVYEGLLDHTAKRATETVLGLAGTRTKEPEIALAELEKFAAKGEKELLKFVKDESGRSESAIKKGLNAEIDDQLASRFRTVCQDSDLWKRVKPFAGLVRLDDVDYPVVITTGSVFVTAGTDRRSSGTHYTPKSLTEPIVQYTLEPLVYVGPAEGLPKDQWKLRSAKELVALKICDMACGSGAFLVQVCRYLSARLLEAWDVIQKANPGMVHITPEGEPSTGKPGEMLIPDDPDERQTYALRIVAQRCLYGVDINPLAVEMAKLSLWLLTLAKDKPFEFLDHAIRCGDSLVGIHNLEQLRHFSLKPESDKSVLYGGPLDEEVAEAIQLRLQLESLPANTVEEVEHQEKLLKKANDQTAMLKCSADMLVAAEFWGESARDKAERVRHNAVRTTYYLDQSKKADEKARSTEEFQSVAAKERRGQTMFHWALEFPEVIVKRGGFDAFVGNPPFMGGRLIGRAISDAYHSYLEQLRCYVKGSPDLCCYFFLRDYWLLRPGGALGLLATKSISETGNRSVGLDQLIVGGATIYNARTTIPWPGSAAIFVSCVHAFKGHWRGAANLDFRQVARIDSGLTECLIEDEPFKLAAMQGRFSQGQDIMGLGFELTEVERNLLIAQDAKSVEVIRPLFKGDDIANSPSLTPYRWAIYFAKMTELEARRYGPAFLRVESLVKPFRDKLTGQIHEKCFWRYWDFRPRLVAEMEAHPILLALPRVSKYFAFRRVHTGSVYNEKTKLLFFHEWKDFAVLQSSLHQEWVYARCGTLGATTINYSTSAALETWAMPLWDRNSSEVDQIGESYHCLRDKIMREHADGLTKVYNRFHDSSDPSESISQLRLLQITMDSSVAMTYGWDDINFHHDFYITKYGRRFTISEPARREVLQRLLKLNHERYAEEVAQGLHDKKKPTAKKATPKKKTANKPANHEASLFNLEDDE